MADNITRRHSFSRPFGGFCVVCDMEHYYPWAGYEDRCPGPSPVDQRRSRAVTTPIGSRIVYPDVVKWHPTCRRCGAPMQRVARRISYGPHPYTGAEMIHTEHSWACPAATADQHPRRYDMNGGASFNRETGIIDHDHIGPIDICASWLADRPRRAPSVDRYGAFPSSRDIVRGDAESARLCDLSGADFRGAQLAGLDAYRAEFDGADLRGAVLDRADLREATFREADLRGASLRAARLYGVDFSRTKLDGARFDGAQLRWTILRRDQGWTGEPEGVVQPSVKPGL